MDLKGAPNATPRARTFCISGFGNSDPGVDLKLEGAPKPTSRARTFCVSGFGHSDPEVDIVERAVTPSGTSAITIHCRPRILALCGGHSNDAVTHRQLKNLRITDERYDIHFIHGPIPVEEGGPATAGLFHGPFWSWLDNTDAQSLNESLVNGVRLVLKVVAAHGPFDGVYGFCNGAIIATLAANVASDYKLRLAVSTNAASTSQHIKRQLVPDSRVIKDARKVGGGVGRAERTSRRASTGAATDRPRPPRCPWRPLEDSPRLASTCLAEANPPSFPPRVLRRQA